MDVPSGYKLELVQVLFRHGARTPAKKEACRALPTCVDQSFVEDYGGYDQLTNVGKKQAHKLGCVLRDHYDDFLGAVYRPQDLHARSSDTDRTKMSLQLVLAGLYPPSPEQTWNSDLAWMPIPTSYLPGDLDFLLKGFQKPRYQQLLKDALQTFPQFRQEELKIKEEFNEFFKERGIYSLDKMGALGCIGIFNVLSTHKTSNARLPDWYTDELYENLKRHVCICFDLFMATIEMGKIFVGSLIKQFVANMNLNGEVNNPRKMYLYSGHEINIASFTRAHHIKDFRYPDYANAVILEKLRNSQNQVFVRMLAWTGKEFITLKLGNFKEFCPIDEYLQIIEYIIPSDEEVDKMLSEMNIDLKRIRTTDSIFRSKRNLS